MDNSKPDQTIYLFLDFDGVTHPRVGSDYFIDSCMEALRDAISNINIAIVVTSTWREDMAIDELSSLLAPLNKPVIGITPVLDDPFVHHVRLEEVEAYLREHGLEGAPWFAIDDTPGFYPGNTPVIWTDPMTGFNVDDQDAVAQCYVVPSMRESESQ